MNSESKVYKTLNKQVIKNVNLFEMILFSLMIIIGFIVFVFGIISNVNNNASATDWIQTVTGFIDAPIGIFAAVALSRKWKYAPLLLLFDALLYGSANFLAGEYALGVVNMIITPLLWLFAFLYMWRVNMSEENKEEVETRKLNLVSGTILALSIIVIATVVALLLMNNSPEPTSTKPEWLLIFNSWFDSFAAILMLAAVILGLLRFREMWFMYFCANIIKIVLFSTFIGFRNFDHASLLVIASGYFINSVYGMFIWSATKNKDK